MIDINKLSKMLGFDKGDVSMLIELFLESSQTSLSEIEDAIEKNDTKTIFKEAHSIKGSAANLMLADIVEIAKELESASTKDQKMQILTIYKKLEEEIENIAQLRYENV